MSKENSEVKESVVIAQTTQGVEIRASLSRLTPYVAVFEVYNPQPLLRTSEVLADFRIVIHDRTAYSGRAVVANLVQTGTLVLCEAKLEPSSFLLPGLDLAQAAHTVQSGFEEFLGQWQKFYKVLPEFKVVVADMSTFLTDLRVWLEQVELQIRSAPNGDRLAMERGVVEEVGRVMVPAFDAMHERLESLSAGIEEELRPVHQNFCKRQLHPLVMCSPFAYRTYHKPLGYAGDYEMVNMIARDPFEGSSLFAKVVNLWFLSQWPAKAHRNRIDYLKHLLEQESLRAERRGRPARVLNLGCGPAREIQEFLADGPLCEHVEFTLLDFNEETVQYTTRILEDLKRRHGRRTGIQVQKKSVNYVLKEGAKPVVNAPGRKFDLIYCAGLFDYLPDRTCKHLMNIFYDWLEPDGLLAATNVVNCKPFRHMLEFVLDWHLIYRDAAQGTALLPSLAAAGDTRVHQDTTTVNLFLEARKAGHA